MKQTLLFLSLFTISTLTFSQNIKVSKEKVIHIVDSIFGKENNDINIYLSNRQINPRESIKTMYKPFISPNYNSWFIFVDEKPFESWSHECKYIFINSKIGGIQVFNEVFPPDYSFLNIIQEKIIKQKGELYKFDINANEKSGNKGVNNNYAIILSGGANIYSNYERYWNDCSAIYSTLTNIYDYQDDHIFVLISDGTNPANDRRMNDGSYQSSPLDLDEDGDNDIQYSATKSNIITVFNKLSDLVTSDDNLFIYSTDHGGIESGTNVFMNLWGEIMRDDEFAVQVNKINAKKIIVTMEQCHSGGFIDDLQQNNRVIATACLASESSWAMPPTYTYNEFVYHWVAAVSGITPSGASVNADSNNDCYVSIKEAFNYANSHDTRPEHPQYNSIPSLLGNTISLFGTITNCTTTNIYNQTFTNNASYSDCKINISNSTVQNGAKLTLDEDCVTSIYGPFEVKLGSSLEVK